MARRVRGLPSSPSTSTPSPPTARPRATTRLYPSKAAFAYTTALNYLLRRGEHNRQRLQVGDASVVFWAEDADAGQASAAEDLFAAFLALPADDASEARGCAKCWTTSRRAARSADLAPNLEPGTRMYVLGLAPNASRLSVRFWQVDTLEVLARRIAQHAKTCVWSRCRGAPSRPHIGWCSRQYRTAGRKAEGDDAINIVIGETMRAILSGGRIRAAYWPTPSCGFGRTETSPACAWPCARAFWRANSAGTFVHPRRRSP
jgi:hypothetical protein